MIKKFAYESRLRRLRSTYAGVSLPNVRLGGKQVVACRSVVGA